MRQSIAGMKMFGTQVFSRHFSLSKVFSSFSVSKWCSELQPSCTYSRQLDGRNGGGRVCPFLFKETNHKYHMMLPFFSLAST